MCSFQFSKHYSELRVKSWSPGKVEARRLGFVANPGRVVPIYVVKLKGGQIARAIYEEELRKRPKM
jgi:hypothetical protein